MSVHLTVYLDRDRGAAKIVVGEEERVLRVGSGAIGSRWISCRCRFRLVRGMCRFYLKSVTPAFELYASPIDFDPLQPAMPISTPGSFAAELAQATGRFYTQGIAEDTNCAQSGVLHAQSFCNRRRSPGRDQTSVLERSRAFRCRSPLLPLRQSRSGCRT
jgi:hypothetical protein